MNSERIKALKQRLYKVDSKIQQTCLCHSEAAKKIIEYISEGKKSNGTGESEEDSLENSSGEQEETGEDIDASISAKTKRTDTGPEGDPRSAERRNSKSGEENISVK